MRRALLPAFLLILGSVILGATVLREPIARAASPFTNVIVGNTPGNPVPVNVQNTDASGDIKVREQGTTQVGGTVSVSNLPATQPISGTVNVGNFPSSFPAAPTTKIIAHDVTTVPANDVAAELLPPKDVSDYREVTLYLSPSATGPGGQVCIASIDGPDGGFILDEFQFGDSVSNGAPTIKTYDPAPPNLELECFNNLNQDVQDTWMLTGRTG